MPIGPDDSSANLHDRLAKLGAGLLLRGLTQLQAGALRATPQSVEGANYAPKIDKAEAAIDWQQPAASIERRLRAFDPFPGCTALLAGESVKVWRGRVVPVQAQAQAQAQAQLPPQVRPGEIMACGDGVLRVACGDGALDLLQLQRPGGRRIEVAEFLRTQAVPR